MTQLIKDMDVIKDMGVSSSLQCREKKKKNSLSCRVPVHDVKEL